MVSVTHGPGFRLGPFTHHRAFLQAVSLAVLDRVPGIVEHAVEPLVQIGDVVAAVEVIVDEDLPVAFEGVAAPLHEMEARQPELPELRDEVAAEELLE